MISIVNMFIIIIIKPRSEGSRGFVQLLYNTRQTFRECDHDRTGTSPAR